MIVSVTYQLVTVTIWETAKTHRRMLWPWHNAITSDFHEGNTTMHKWQCRTVKAQLLTIWFW